jgi:hypothetical protein
MLYGYEPYDEGPSFDTPELSSDVVVRSTKDGVFELCLSIGIEQSQEFKAWTNTVTTMVDDNFTAWSITLPKEFKSTLVQFFKLGVLVEKNINFAIIEEE